MTQGALAGIRGTITPTGYLAPRMSPGLRPPPLFRCARHPIVVIDERRARAAGTTGAPLVRRASGTPRSEIKEEAEGRGTFAEGSTRCPPHAPRTFPPDKSTQNMKARK